MKNWSVTFKILLAVSVFAIALPFVVYALQRLIGDLTGPQAWAAQGVEHGPWHGAWEGFTLFLPVMVWAPITVIASVAYAVFELRLQPAISGLGLLGLQAAALLIQLETLVWLID